MERSQTPQLALPDETILIRRARGGDPEAFGQLVVHYTPILYRVIRRMAQDDLEAESVVQEAFLRAWQSLGRYREGQPFFPYLVTIALNVSRDVWRRVRFLDFGELEVYAETLPSEDPGLELFIETRETLDALAQAVAGLPPAYRAVIALRYDAGLSYAEIATVLGLPVNTVRTHLRRAKIDLRNRLESQE